MSWNIFDLLNIVCQLARKSALVTMYSHILYPIHVPQPNLQTWLNPNHTSIYKSISEFVRFSKPISRGKSTFFLTICGAELFYHWLRQELLYLWSATAGPGRLLIEIFTQNTPQYSLKITSTGLMELMQCMSLTQYHFIKFCLFWWMLS